MFSDLSMSSDVQLSIVAINLILLNFTYAAYMYVINVNDIIFFIKVFRVHTEDFLSICFAYRNFKKHNQLNCTKEKEDHQVMENHQWLIYVYHALIATTTSLAHKFKVSWHHLT